MKLRAKFWRHAPSCTHLYTKLIEVKCVVSNNSTPGTNVLMQLDLYQFILQLMAQQPSLPGFEEHLHSSVTPKSESASRPMFIAHHGYDLTGNIRDADLRLDYLTPDFGDVTEGTHGRPLHSSVQAPSSYKESITSTGVWDVKPECLTTQISGPSSLYQVTEELRHLITSRQSNPSSNTGQDTDEGYKNPPQIQNVSYLLQTCLLHPCSKVLGIFISDFKSGI